MTDKRNAVRRGGKLRINVRVGNAEVFDIEALTLQVPLPSAFTYLKSKLTAAPDSVNGPKGTPQVKATLQTGNIVTWNPFLLPANMSRPRLASVWVRVKKDASTGSLTYGPAKIINNTDTNCMISSNTETVRGADISLGIRSVKEEKDVELPQIK